jgi:hypothetical protein
MTEEILDQVMGEKRQDIDGIHHIARNIQTISPLVDTDPLEGIGMMHHILKEIEIGLLIDVTQDGMIGIKLLNTHHVTCRSSA